MRASLRRRANFQFPISSFFLRKLAGAIPLILAAASDATAQGCALCANNASALKSAAARALESGILILLIPVVLITIGIAGLAFYRRNRFHDAGFSPDSRWSHGGLSPLEPPEDSGAEVPVEIHSGAA